MFGCNFYYTKTQNKNKSKKLFTFLCSIHSSLSGYRWTERPTDDPLYFLVFTFVNWPKTVNCLFWLFILFQRTKAHSQKAHLLEALSEKYFLWINEVYYDTKCFQPYGYYGLLRKKLKKHKLILN